jgi:hypothetical protein
MKIKNVGLGDLVKLKKLPLDITTEDNEKGFKVVNIDEGCIIGFEMQIATNSLVEKNIWVRPKSVKLVSKAKEVEPIKIVPKEIVIKGSELMHHLITIKGKLSVPCLVSDNEHAVYRTDIVTGWAFEDSVKTFAGKSKNWNFANPINLKGDLLEYNLCTKKFLNLDVTVEEV